MLAHYGVDVLDPAVSLRRIHVLVRRLPAGAWPDPKAAASWSTESHLLALLADLVSGLIYVTQRAAGARNVARPRPLPRPGDTRTGRRLAAAPPGHTGPTPREGSWAALAAALTGQRGVEVEIVG